MVMTLRSEPSRFFLKGKACETEKDKLHKNML